MKQCNICGFNCKNNVGSYIGSNAKVLFLFETPTYQADLENRITAGPVMELFKQYLTKHQISFDDIAITYMSHCFSGTPTKDQAFKLTNNPVKKKYYENCRHHLDKILNDVKPKLVVCVGDRPTKYFLGDTKAKLFDVYGAIIKSPLYKIDTFCMLDMYKLYLKTQYRCYGDKSFEFIKNFIDGIKVPMQQTNCTVTVDIKLLHEALSKLLTSTKTTIDIETSGLNFLKDKIMGIGFALDKENSYYIPLHKYENDKIVSFWDEQTENLIKEDLKKFVSNETLKIAYNGQFDFKFIRHYLNVDRINNASFDVMLASHLLNENLNGMRSLKLLSVLFTDMGGYESVLYNWLREHKIVKDDMYKAPVDILGTYCCLDTIATYRLYSKFDIQLEREGLLDVFKKLTMPLQKVLMDVEYDGVQVDVNHLAEIEKNNKKALEDKLAVIRGKVGDPEFNVNSTQQLADLMFKKLGCKVLRTTDSGNPATDKATISKYAKKHSVLQDILDYKKIRTETSTFITGMKALLDDNNKVHTNYLLHGTESGRISSQHPNLQNCFDNKTEILTKAGFKLFKDLTDKDLVAQWDNNIITFVKPLDYIKNKYVGDLVYLHNQHINICGTPDHRYLVFNRKTGNEKVGLLENYPSDYKQLHAGLYIGGNVSLSNEIITILAATQADGYYHKDGLIQYDFKKKRKYDRLIKALNTLNYDFYDRGFNKNKKSYGISLGKFHECNKLIKSILPNKIWTWDLLNWDLKSLQVLMEEIHFWDGCFTRQSQYTSKVSQNIDVIQAICVLINQRAHYRVYKQKYSNREYPTLDITKKRNFSLTTNIKKEYISYNDYVYCVTVPSDNIIIRREGQVVIIKNCPREKTIKNLYIPEPGKVMIQCDLSQGEFNAWASYAQDAKMLNDIKNGLDIHRTVASKVWNMKPEDVTKELRTFAKRVVFGLMYGISIEGAAKLVGCSESEAQRIQTTFFGMYPKAAAWLKNIPVVARANGYLQTVFGRKRRLSHLFNHPLQSIRNYANRVSSNFPMQSTVADITARNMINLKPYLDSVGAQIILTVHDSIIVQCDKAIAKQVSEEMMKIVTQPVPNYHGIIRCDIEIGEAWGHLDKVEFDEDTDKILNEDIFSEFEQENT